MWGKSMGIVGRDRWLSFYAKSISMELDKGEEEEEEKEEEEQVEQSSDNRCVLWRTARVLVFE